MLDKTWEICTSALVYHADASMAAVTQQVGDVAPVELPAVEISPEVEEGNVPNAPPPLSNPQRWKPLSPNKKLSSTAVRENFRLL